MLTCRTGVTHHLLITAAIVLLVLLAAVVLILTGAGLVSERRWNARDCGRSWQTVTVTGLEGTLPADRTYLTSVRLVTTGDVAVFVGNDRTQTLVTALSADAGATWQPVLLPEQLTASTDVSLLDSTNWWMFRPASIYTTDDAGTSWREAKPSGLPAGWNLETARAVDGTHAWAALVSGASSERHSLAVTADGGAHWQLVTMPLP